MIWLNEVNGADQICTTYHRCCMHEFGEDIAGAVLGSAYGGELESMSKLWGKRGSVYGFDTFEDLHPGHLSQDQSSFEVVCMQHWYDSPDHGTEKLALDYQQAQLDEMGLDNVKLIKGEVHKDSCKDIPYLNYVFLDMDIYQSMANGYSAIREKMVENGILLIHDSQNIPDIRKWVEREVTGRDGKMWRQFLKCDGQLIIGFRRTGWNL